MHLFSDLVRGTIAYFCSNFFVQIYKKKKYIFFLAIMKATEWSMCLGFKRTCCAHIKLDKVDFIDDLRLSK